MSLLNGLSAVAGSLDAQRYGLTVAGQNIANLNTEGYVRRSVVLTEVQPGAGGGVQATGVQAHRDTFVEARLLAELLPEQRAGAIADSLAVVETTLGAAGTSLDHDLTAFFDAFATLAQDPTSATARQGVLQKASLLVRGFHDVSTRLDAAATAADAQVRDSVTEINTLASKIASLNGAIARTAGADAETLKDQLGVALKSLAGLTSTAVVRRADGGIDVTTAGGLPIVLGGTAYALGVTSVGPGGLASVTIGGTDVTSKLTDGKLGGLLYARDTLIPGYKTQLDQLAFSVTQQVNTVHQAGFNLNGSTGTNFFTPQGAVAGAAAAFGVVPSIAADASLVAASATVAIGGNETAQAIAALRDARVAGGGTSTFTQAWSQLVYQVGSDAQAAIANQKSRQAIVSTLTRLRDAVSGVSLDEEAGTMLKFQRAYEANAKYFTVVSDMLDTLMGMVR
jgi:flagellar hook-associated protein 1 FlgK